MRHTVLVQTRVDGASEELFALALQTHEKRVREREGRIEGVGSVIINSTTAISYSPGLLVVYLTDLLVEDAQPSE